MKKATSPPRNAQFETFLAHLAQMKRPAPETNANSNKRSDRSKPAPVSNIYTEYVAKGATPSESSTPKCATPSDSSKLSKAAVALDAIMPRIEKFANTQHADRADIALRTDCFDEEVCLRYIDVTLEGLLTNNDENASTSLASFVSELNNPFRTQRVKFESVVRSLDFVECVKMFIDEDSYIGKVLLKDDVLNSDSVSNFINSATHDDLSVLEEEAEKRYSADNFSKVNNNFSFINLRLAVFVNIRKIKAFRNPAALLNDVLVEAFQQLNVKMLETPATTEGIAKACSASTPSDSACGSVANIIKSEKCDWLPLSGMSYVDALLECDHVSIYANLLHWLHASVADSVPNRDPVEVLAGCKHNDCEIVEVCLAFKLIKLATLPTSESNTSSNLPHLEMFSIKKFIQVLAMQNEEDLRTEACDRYMEASITLKYASVAFLRAEWYERLATLHALEILAASNPCYVVVDLAVRK